MIFRKLRERYRRKRIWAKRAKMSRIEYLLDISHDMLEGREYSRDGLNSLELVEKQLTEGEIDLAIRNLSGQPADCFQIANLYWGQGDLANAEKYLRMTLERYERFVAIGRQHGKPIDKYRHYGEFWIKAAALLLDVELGGPALTSKFDAGYRPAFDNFLLDCCLGKQEFDMGAWQALEDAWLGNRFPKSTLAEYAIYVTALTGGFADDATMLKAHERMWLGKAKMNREGSLIEGYGDDNALIIDHLFASVLKRIGWEGTYRHSWPGTCPVGTAPITTQSAQRHLKTIAAPPPAPDADTGIIADPQEARRYIDTQVKDQRDWWEKEHVDPVRPAKERGKVAKALKDIEWKADPVTLDLMRTYRMDTILNDSTHVFLSDPIGDRYCSLKKWTGLFVEEFGMSPDFIAVAESEEKSDYMDPQGGWYVFWKKDRRIYLVQRDQWDDPKVATANARIGKELWPSYISFAAWWVSQHVENKG